jgi:hypothetical protein
MFESKPLTCGECPAIERAWVNTANAMGYGCQIFPTFVNRCWECVGSMQELRDSKHAKAATVYHLRLAHGEEPASPLATAELDAATTKAIAERIIEQYERDGYDHMREWLGDYIIKEAIPDFWSGCLVQAATVAMKVHVDGCFDGWREGDVWREIDMTIKRKYQAREEYEERLRRR